MKRRIRKGEKDGIIKIRIRIGIRMRFMKRMDKDGLKKRMIRIGIRTGL